MGRARLDRKRNPEVSVACGLGSWVDRRSDREERAMIYKTF